MEIPLQLWNQPHWELKGRWEAERFFRCLADAMPDASTLFIEGTSIAVDVEEFLRSAAEPGEYLPKSQTILPRPKQFRVSCGRSTLNGLAELADRHAEPELLDHLFVYDGMRVLVEAPDAFFKGSVMYFSADVGEQQMRRLAEALGLEVTFWDPDQGSSVLV